MKVECSVCQVEVEESTTLQGEDGLVCDKCNLASELPDVGKLLRRDDLRLGAFLAFLGMAFLAAAAYLANMLMQAAEAEAALQEQGVTLSVTSRGSGYVLMAFVIGFAALAAGTVKIWRAR